MERRILALGRALRDGGAPVSTPEVLDAGRAALAVGVRRRDDLRAALRASLVKRLDDVPAFDEHFERLFPAGIPRPARRRGDRGAGAAGAGPADEGAGGGAGTAAGGMAAQTARSDAPSRETGDERRGDTDGGLGETGTEAET
ncbi:MAG TPA: hypothetical protein VI078_07895, partial [bacterium]